MNDSGNSAEALNIRPAAETDLRKVLEIYAQPDLDDGVVMSLDEAREVFERFSRYPDYTLYVACVGDEIVATFALLIMDNLAHLGTPSGIIEDIAVAPEWQRRGIGRRMIEFALDRCRAKGCYKLALSANAKRASAHAFYESLGFTRHGYSFAVELAARIG
jgi:GNAT superfamily N-acetyltransferase